MEYPAGLVHQAKFSVFLPGKDSHDYNHVKYTLFGKRTSLYIIALELHRFARCSTNTHGSFPHCCPWKFQLHLVDDVGKSSLVLRFTRGSFMDQKYDLAEDDSLRFDLLSVVNFGL